MKSIKYCMIIIMIMTIITSCSKKEVVSHKYTFEGESTNWIGELEVKIIENITEKDEIVEYDPEQKKEFILTYKGEIDDLKPLKELKYKFEYRCGSGSGKIEKHNTKVVSHNSSSRGGTLINQEEVITVTVEHGEDIEIFELKSTD
ncbi:hypothetical protein HZI73_15630 [Vallitalea pronyensis]|uniref:Lipoprotein n=1 Tax=Vallitalea pronyensis TaxID=1348613 RepID=A0A8J8MLD0_9FIRM|nr:hypothetical protein [Vallitalea pronyensis]QUI23631.1 hypothetical protein HZI73_15630 [Vallitalea pronyensis]